MRRSLAVAIAVMALASAPRAQADWSPGSPYTFVQGQTYSLSYALEQPVLDFLALELLVDYSPLVYEPLQLTPGALSDQDFIVVSYAPRPDLPNGMKQVKIDVTPSPLAPPAAVTADGWNIPAGQVFSVKFKIQPDAPLTLHAGDVVGAATLTLVDPTGVLDSIVIPINASISPTIVAAPVPEPEAWVTLLAGIALVGSMAARRRRLAFRPV